jgi:hypothetical protein
MNASKRIAVIGAGPIGLEAALYARTLGFEVTIYDRGEVAENVRTWSFVRLFTPWSMNVTPPGRAALRETGAWEEPPATECPTGHEYRQRYLQPLANSPKLRDALRTNTNVITIGRDEFTKVDAIGQPQRAQSPFRILVRDSTGRERIDHADVIFDCTGTYGNHRWAGRGGIPAPGEQALASRIWYTIPDVLGRDRGRFADRHTLILGCGYSAATVLDAIEQLRQTFPATQVSWAIRRPGQALQAIHGDVLPARRELVMKALRLADNPPPWLQFLGTCVLEELSPAGVKFSATLRAIQTTLVIQVDEIAALVGYTPDASIYEQLQIHECYATGGPIKLSAALLGESSKDCMTAGASLTAETLTNPEPNFFILGAKSYGTNSNFLIQLGHRQIADAFRLIRNDPKLNLYDC